MQKIYPSLYLRFAKTMFYVFVGLFGLFETSPRADGQLLSAIAQLGAANAVFTWWVIDCMVRKADIPFLSLTPAMKAWPLLFPAHFLATRGRRSLAKLLVHVAFALIALLLGVGAGVTIW